MQKQAHLYIKGDVIGVGFRAWTKIQSKITGVGGWVKNVPAGVEIVIQGEEDKVNRMVEIVRPGPPTARVDEVKISWETPKEIFEKFEIRR